MFPGMAGDLYADALTCVSLINMVMLILHGLDRLRDVRCMTEHVDRVAGLQNALVDLHNSDAKMAVIMRHNTDRFFVHRWFFDGWNYD